MTAKFLEENPPPFPNATMNPSIANLQTIKFAPLLDRDETELKSLVRACEEDGFFYLDLSDQGAGKLFNNLDALSKLVKKWMKQPREKKCQTVTSKEDSKAPIFLFLFFFFFFFSSFFSFFQSKEGCIAS